MAKRKKDVKASAKSKIENLMFDDFWKWCLLIGALMAPAYVFMKQMKNW